MNTIKTKGVILYDYQPFSKGKYKHETSKIAIKKLCFIKHLKLTAPREYFCWDISNSPLAFKRLFKLCKSFKTNFKIPHKLSNPLKSAPLKRISLALPHKSNYVLIRKTGVKYPLSRLTLTYPNQAKHLSTVFSILQGQRNLFQFRLKLSEGSYVVKEQELSLFSKGVNKMKHLQSLNIDTYYFAGITTMVRSFFKSMAMWNLVSIHIYMDLSNFDLRT